MSSRTTALVLTILGGGLLFFLASGDAASAPGLVAALIGIAAIWLAAGRTRFVLAAVSGLLPGMPGNPPGPKAALRIFCCDMLSEMLARSGLPSGEKNSSVSSMPSTSPSNTNDPQAKRSPAGT